MTEAQRKARADARELFAAIASTAAPLGDDATQRSAEFKIALIDGRVTDAAETLLRGMASAMGMPRGRP